MWRASHQDGLSFDPNLLQPQHQAVLRTSAHDATFRHQQQASQEVSEQHNSECMQAHLSSQLNGNFAHGLPPALLPEAAHGQAADLPNVQLDLDTATLSAALGLGDNFLAHLHRNIGENTGQSSSELSAILAASLGVLPGTSSINTLLGQDGSASSFVGSPPLPSLLPQSSLANAKDNQPIPKTVPASNHSKPALEVDEHAESDEHSEGEGSAGTKRKGPMSEEDRKRRRQEINRQSARRIRERRSLEMERLKQQNSLLQQQQAVLLRYASALSREKNVLVQRTIELTERWNQTAAENLELRERVKGVSSAGKASTGQAAHPYGHLQPQNTLTEDAQQILTHGSRENAAAYPA